MGNNTTIVELAIEPADLREIIQNWALQSKFSIDEQTNNRTVYSKNILLTKAWLSIENNAGDARLEAWISPPGVGSDFSGNIWLGWKTAVPKKYGIGPQSIYKKQFDLLLALLTSKAKNISLSESNQKGDKLQPTLKKSSLIAGLASYGAINLAVGLIGVMAVRTFVSSYLPASSERMLFDSLFNMFFGILIIVCSWILAKGKILAVWLYSAGILLASIYSIAVGYGLNYFFVGLGLLFIWQMLRFRNERGLA